MPLALNVATESSRVVNVPLVSMAPTAITYGSMAGSDSRLPPLLPAETTTTIPLRQATSAAYASGSSTYDWRESVPKDRLSTRMFRPGSWACWTTQSIAGDDLRHVAAALGVGDLDADDARVRGDALVVGGVARVGVDAGVAARDEAGHEGPVAEGVQVGGVGVLRLEREVGAVDDL